MTCSLTAAAATASASRTAPAIKVVNIGDHAEADRTHLDTENGVFINNATNVLDPGNVFKDFESGVEVTQSDTTHSVKVVGNYGEKPKGPFPRGQYVQFYPCNKNGTIRRSGAR